MLEALWFWLVALMICGYIVFDGFDLGAGALHLLLARTGEERRAVLRSIGPVWDGNEVWLLAAGGTLYFAFPGLYASSFSGFYLPLMLVLWLLVLRGISIEFRNHMRNPVWTPFWDVVFCLASGLLALFLGVALGNVVRGVPLNADGWFFEPLWTHFRVGERTGILDWYTLVIGIASLLSLALHGALWIWLKTEGDVSTRAHRAAGILWPLVILMVGVVTTLTWIVQPIVSRHMTAAPGGFLLAALALAGLGGVLYGLARGRPRAAFLSSAAYLVGMLASVAYGLFPYVLPANSNPAYGLTLYSVSAPASGLRIGLYWWIPGMLVAGAYFVFVYRHFRGKVDTAGEGY
jgi:cytochrome d ubiquinol oxidase subunit II